MSHSVSLLSTGIPALDRVLGGGIPPRQVLLVAGHPGSGKTILASQVAFAQAARRAPVLLATAASEPHTKVLETLQRFSFFNRERVGREIFLLSIYPWLRKGVRETREMILSSVREQRAQLLVIDGIRSLRDIWRDESQIREFLSELGVGLSSHDCTAVLTLEASPDRILETPEAATVDGVLTLPFERHGLRRERALEVVKVRGQRHIAGAHTARLGNDGFELHVRLESEGAARDPRRGAGHSGFGHAALDAWLGGGLGSGGVTALHGPHGAGKSYLGLVFAAAAGDRGALLVSFGEPAEAMVARGREQGLATGRVQAFTPEVLEMMPDGVAHQILQRAEGVGRVVLDGAQPLFEAVSPDRRYDFTRALLGRLAEGGRDVLLTSPDGAVESVAGAVDNLLQISIPSPGRLRELQVRKLREASLPNNPFSFTLGKQGIEGAQG
jgi:circadian clock protein KaiC